MHNRQDAYKIGIPNTQNTYKMGILTDRILQEGYTKNKLNAYYMGIHIWQNA
jgi:hypothetical protein